MSFIDGISDYWLLCGAGVLCIILAYCLGYCVGFKRGFDGEKR